MGELIDLAEYRRRLEEEKAEAERLEEEKKRLEAEKKKADEEAELEYMRDVVSAIIRNLEDAEEARAKFFFVPFPTGSQLE
jgi:L-fucose isomerase-like protein